MTWFKWSRTASSNANADSTINWAEGQAPSSINDSARAVMAAAAKYRDDIAGANTTAGTSTAYTLTSYQVFDSFANMNGAMIAFVPHTTSGASPRLNVDGLGLRALRSAPSVELPNGALIAGTPYVGTYFDATTEWILHGGLVNPYSIPLGGLMPYLGTSAPNSAFAFPYGQAVSRTTYANLFSLVSTNYGSGDGSTTFNLPDIRGRVIACPDNMGGSAALRLTGYSHNSVGGTQNQQLALTNLPAQTTPDMSVSGTFSGSGTGTATNGQAALGGSTPGVVVPSLSGGGANGNSLAVSVGVSGSISGTAAGAAMTGQNATAFGIIQPTMTLNYVLRVI